MASTGFIEVPVNQLSIPRASFLSLLHDEGSHYLAVINHHPIPPRNMVTKKGCIKICIYHTCQDRLQFYLYSLQTQSKNTSIQSHQQLVQQPAVIGRLYSMMLSEWLPNFSRKISFGILFVISSFLVHSFPLSLKKV